MKKTGAEARETGQAQGPKPNLNELRSQETRQRILAAAHAQFVANGLEGTRMEAIALSAGVNKSLVYRHFGNRETLYCTVLDRAYAQIRAGESALELPDDPHEALARVVDYTFDYYIANPDFLVLVGIENLNKGEFLRRVDKAGLNVDNLKGIYRKVLDMGMEQGVFRRGVDPVDLYFVASSLCWYTVATQYTFGITFETDVLSKENLASRRRIIHTAVRGFLTEPQPEAPV